MRYFSEIGMDVADLIFFRVHSRRSLQCEMHASIPTSKYLENCQTLVIAKIIIIIIIVVLAVANFVVVVTICVHSGS